MKPPAIHLAGTLAIPKPGNQDCNFSFGRGSNCVFRYELKPDDIELRGHRSGRECIWYRRLRPLLRVSHANSKRKTQHATYDKKSAHSVTLKKASNARHHPPAPSGCRNLRSSVSAVWCMPLLDGCRRIMQD